MTGLVNVYFTRPETALHKLNLESTTWIFDLGCGQWAPIRMRLMVWGLINIALIFVQGYVADKVHCVYLVDGEMKVLFECKQFKGPEQLGSAPIDLVLNKELIQEYLDSMGSIPHIKKTVTLEPTKGLQVLKKKN